jgi:hypothetical protein
MSGTPFGIRDFLKRGRSDEIKVSTEGPGDSQTCRNLREKRYHDESVKFVFGVKIHSHTKHIVIYVELPECNALQRQHMRKGSTSLFVRYRPEVRYGACNISSN